MEKNVNVNQNRNINRISDMGIFTIKFCMVALVLIGIAVLVINNSLFSIIGAIGALIAIIGITSVN